MRQIPPLNPKLKYSTLVRLELKYDTLVLPGQTAWFEVFEARLRTGKNIAFLPPNGPTPSVSHKFDR